MEAGLWVFFERNPVLCFRSASEMLTFYFRNASAFLPVCFLFASDTLPHLLPLFILRLMIEPQRHGECARRALTQAEFCKFSYSGCGRSELSKNELWRPAL